MSADREDTATAGVPQIGDVVASKYKVERVLGVGGMGVVLQVRHLQLGQRLALKFLLPAALAHPDALVRFLREGRAAVAIQSEHVARVLDVGSLNSGAPYMVMEFLAGSDLGVRLRTKGPLPVATAVEYLLQALEAIAEAHSKGVIHRDLKPSNIFLSRRADGSPLVKVLDFGISKIIDPERRGDDRTVTATAQAMGSPLYMSPEQVMSAKDVTFQTDIWSLGLILQELVSGKRAFDGESNMAVLARIMAGAPEPLSLADGSTPPVALEKAIAGCLQKSQQERFKSVAELARTLEPLASVSAKRSIQRINDLEKGSLSFDTTAQAGQAPASDESGPTNDTHAVTNASDSPGRTRTRGRTIVMVCLAAGIVAGLIVSLKRQEAGDERRSLAGNDIGSVHASATALDAQPENPASSDPQPGLAGESAAADHSATAVASAVSARAAAQPRVTVGPARTTGAQQPSAEPKSSERPAGPPNPRGPYADPD